MDESWIASPKHRLFQGRRCSLEGIWGVISAMLRKTWPVKPDEAIGVHSCDSRTCSLAQRKEVLPSSWDTSCIPSCAYKVIQKGRKPPSGCALTNKLPGWQQNSGPATCLQRDSAKSLCWLIFIRNGQAWDEVLCSPSKG